MFVLSLNNELYVGKKKRGSLHHSSFLAGGPCLCAGMISIRAGVVEWLMPHSGHYRPRTEHVAALYQALTQLGVDMSQVRLAKPSKWDGPWAELTTSDVGSTHLTTTSEVSSGATLNAASHETVPVEKR